MNNIKKTKEIVREQNKHLYIQLKPEVNESISKFCIRIFGHLKRYNYHIAKVSCFGSLNNREAFESEMKLHATDPFPITWVEGENCSESFLNGIQLWAVKADVKYLSTNFNAKAIYFEDDDARYLFIGDIISGFGNEEGAGYPSLLKKVESFLLQNGFLFTDVIRTWYYLDDILSWYDEFNQIRTDFFKHTGVFKNGLPASTGVSGKNKMGLPTLMELLAVNPKSESVTVAEVKSPQQNEANAYGSSFSRAVKFKSNSNKKWMSISGTASILPSGETAHIGNLEKQIQCSFEVVQDILQQEGYDFDDVVRATAYLKNKSSLPILKSFLYENPKYHVPLIISENTICRDNLLFEIEMDLVKFDLVHDSTNC